jgi:predicted RNA-binding protein with PIN domain
VRTIILDGYNVILRSPAFRPDERLDLAAARNKLENLLSWAVGTLADVRFLLVFDGADLPGQAKRKTTGVRDAEGGSRVDIRYSTPPQKADDLIRVLVRELTDNEREVTVVTSDLEVARDVQAMGATIVFSDLFAASLFADKAVGARAKVGKGKGKGKGKAAQKRGGPTHHATPRSRAGTSSQRAHAQAPRVGASVALSRQRSEPLPLPLPLPFRDPGSGQALLAAEEQEGEDADCRQQHRYQHVDDGARLGRDHRGALADDARAE